MYGFNVASLPLWHFPILVSPWWLQILTGRDHGVSLTIFQNGAKYFLANIKANLKKKAHSKYMGSKPRWRRISLEWDDILQKGDQSDLEINIHAV